jgi:hypothetical protein
VGSALIGIPELYAQFDYIRNSKKCLKFHPTGNKRFFPLEMPEIKNVASLCLDACRKARSASCSIHYFRQVKQNINLQRNVQNSQM